MKRQLIPQGTPINRFLDARPPYSDGNGQKPREYTWTYHYIEQVVLQLQSVVRKISTFYAKVLYINWNDFFFTYPLHFCNLACIWHLFPNCSSLHHDDVAYGVGDTFGNVNLTFITSWSNEMFVTFLKFFTFFNFSLTN